MSVNKDARKEFRDHATHYRTWWRNLDTEEKSFHTAAATRMTLYRQGVISEAGLHQGDFKEFAKHLSPLAMLGLCILIEQDCCDEDDHNEH